MRIIIDGDACPVIEQTEKIARKYNIELMLFCDYNHNIKLKYGKVIKVDQSFQSVDMIILNKSKKDDIIITDDYGLASLVLAKECLVLNSKGMQYTENNIDYLLMKRHINKKIRDAGKQHPTSKKRTKKADLLFKNKLKFILKNKKDF